MTVFIDVLLIAAIVGTGIAAGVFYAFSAFVTQGLDRLEPSDAARAMQELNITAVRAPLMVELFGTALVAAVVFVLALLGSLEDATWWALAASVVGADVEGPVSARSGPSGRGGGSAARRVRGARGCACAPR